MDGDGHGGRNRDSRDMDASLHLVGNIHRMWQGSVFTAMMSTADPPVVEQLYGSVEVFSRTICEEESMGGMREGMKTLYTFTSTLLCKDESNRCCLQGCNWHMYVSFSAMVMRETSETKRIEGRSRSTLGNTKEQDEHAKNWLSWVPKSVVPLYRSVNPGYRG
jgi:hypothetical protein